MAGSCCEDINGDFGFRKIWGVSILVEELVAYQKVPRCMELVFEGPVVLCCCLLVGRFGKLFSPLIISSLVFRHSRSAAV